MSDTELQLRLREIGEALKKAPAGSSRYRRLMAELDRLLGTEEKPRDKEAEEAWEKSRQ